MVSLLNSKSIGFRTGNSDPILEENNAGNFTNVQSSNQAWIQGSRQVLAWSMTGVLAHLNYVEQKRRQL